LAVNIGAGNWTNAAHSICSTSYIMQPVRNKHLGLSQHIANSGLLLNAHCSLALDINSPSSSLPSVRSAASLQ